MHPHLFVLPLPGPDFQVATYRAALMVAAVVTVALAYAFAVWSGLERKRALAVIVACAFALLVGARAWNMYGYWSTYAAEPSRIWTLQATGLSMFGGILAVAVVGFALASALRIDPWRLADAGAPALALGIAIMRVGCFASGCCFGMPARVPWAVTFPAGSPSHLWQIGHDVVGLFEAPLSVHPTQLYELAGALIAGLVAWWLLAHRATPGIAFLTFVSLFTVVRSVNIFFRAPSPTALSAASVGIFLYLYPMTIAACVILGVWRCRRARDRRTDDAMASPSGL